MFTTAERSAMERACELAVTVTHPVGPNPRVGAVLLSTQGVEVGSGYHRGPGTVHAEVAALETAGGNARGCTAVVTLEPCDHHGLTGPCTQALIDAGVARVVYAVSDPNPIAAGGADVLRRAGIDVASGLCSEQASAINPEWAIAAARSRPFVTVKLAATLDGRVAAADGSSRWITGLSAREDVHRLRSSVDAVAVGTGTVIADDPELTDRRPEAGEFQPIRVVIGVRPVPGSARILDGTTESLVLGTRDLAQALSELFSRGVRHVLIEGGPTLATAFIRADLVDRLVWYVAPKILGGGTPAIENLGIESISAALRWEPSDVTMLGSDVRITLVRDDSVVPDDRVQEA